MKLNFKLTAAFIVVGIVATQILFWQSYISSTKVIEKEAFNKLTSVRESKKQQIQGYFTLLKNQIETLAEGKMVLQAANDFNKSYKNIRLSEKDFNFYNKKLNYYYGNVFEEFTAEKKVDETSDLKNKTSQIYLQYQYIANNPYPEGAKATLTQSQFKDDYSQIHALYHTNFRNYIKRFGFNDLLLIDQGGNIVYSVNKKPDFATNLIHGSLKNSNLADAFKRANMQSQAPNAVLVDFEHYAPSSGAPAAFIATPLLLKDEQIGVLILQISINKLNAIMTGNKQWQKDGLGMSGESYLLGPDLTMRSDSRFLIEPAHSLSIKLTTQMDDNLSHLQAKTSVLQQTVSTSTSLKALSGRTGTEIVNDYRNIPVLSSYTPADIEGLNWVILSDMDVDEVYAPLYELKRNGFIVILGISLAIILFAIAFTRKITSPIQQLQQGIQEVEQGDFGHTLPIETHDEIGLLAQAFNRMRQSLNDTMVSRNYLDDILSSMSESIFVIQCSNLKRCKAIIEMTNPAAGKILNEAVSALVGHSFLNYFPNQQILTAAEWQILFSEGQLNPTDKIIITKQGKAIHVSMSAALLEKNSSGASSIIFIIQDISTRKAQEEKIRHLAAHDSLTDLPNRRFFGEQLKQTIAQAQRYKHQSAVMFIDLDKFKPVNDTLGHDVGDHLLIQVADRMLAQIRQSDTVARLGGDEFAIILPEISNEKEVEIVAEKILNALNETFLITDKKIKISCSIGIATFPEDGSDCEEILRNADTAMYFSKKSGRGCYRFYEKSMAQDSI